MSPATKAAVPAVLTLLAVPNPFGPRIPAGSAVPEPDRNFVDSTFAFESANSFRISFWMPAQSSKTSNDSGTKHLQIAGVAVGCESVGLLSETVPASVPNDATGVVLLTPFHTFD